MGKSNQSAHPIAPWQHWIDNIEDLLSIAYVIRYDKDLTLLNANHAFYQMLNLSKEDARSKYGNRLATLLDTEWLSYVTQLEEGAMSQPIHCKQHLKTQNGNIYLQTSIIAYGSVQGAVLCCMAMDISEYELLNQEWTSFEETIFIAATQTGINYVDYNLDTREVKVCADSSRLLQPFINDKKVCPQFVERLVKENVIPAKYEKSWRDAFELLHNGEEKSVCEIPMNVDDTTMWVRLTLVRKKNAQFAVCIFEDITKERISLYNYLNETQFFQAMLSEKTAYAQVDVSKDRITRIGGMWNLYNEVINKITYSSLIQEFINKIVHPEDRKHYLEVMQCSNFIESLQNGINQVGCQFRRITDQNKMMWMELSARLFSNPVTDHVHALLTISNIDEMKKQELSILADKRNEETIQQLPFISSTSSVSLFDHFVGEFGEIAYIVDADTYEYICGNKAFFDRIGVSERECKNKACYELMHKRSAPCPFCSKANWTTDKFHMWKNVNQVLEQEFLLKNKLVTWQGKEVLLTIAIDVSNDKSILDTIDNTEMEAHSILSGVQKMVEAANLSEAMTSAMETIASFFRADQVSLWQKSTHKEGFRCMYQYDKGANTTKIADITVISKWLDLNHIEGTMILESPDAMLGYSYEMYTYMKSHNIGNQRWIKIKENDSVLGFISINNISSNFQNVGFLHSFQVFIASELRKRNLMDSALYLQHHDDLTSLLSRKSFEEYMTTYNPDVLSSLGVFVFNIDDLKGINNAKGFQSGNYYISQFAEILSKVFHDHIVFRLDGDEFLVIAANVDQKQMQDLTKGIEAQIVEIGTFSASLGSSWDDVEKDISLLSEQATIAMRVNKKQYYETKPISDDDGHRKMLNELRESIEKNEFEVFLQPKVELEHNTLFGAEALIRYNHPEKGYIPPSYFIETLEQNNLIRYIDLFVFEQVCIQLDTWKKQSIFLPIVSLNFSRITLLERDLLETMEFIIAKYDVSKEHIEIEITESIASTGKAVVYEVAKNMFDAGYAISLDDFGTKYTNLAILSELNFNVLKVDRGLVNQLGKQGNLEIILKNVIQMCKDMNIHVIAEGIETKQQEIMLKELGCMYGQGYLYGPPMPIEAFVHQFILCVLE